MVDKPRIGVLTQNNSEKFKSFLNSFKSMSLRIFFLEFLSSREGPLHFPSTVILPLLLFTFYTHGSSHLIVKFKAVYRTYIGVGLGSLFTVQWLGLLS